MFSEGLSVRLGFLSVKGSGLNLNFLSDAQTLVRILLARSSKSFISSRVVGGEGVGTNFKFLLSTCISSSESVIFDNSLYMFSPSQSYLSRVLFFCFPEFSFLSLFLNAYYIHNSYMRGASFLHLHFYFDVPSLYCHLLEKQVVCYFCHSY